MSDRDFIAYLHELLAPAGKVSARAMFGGWGVYVDGTIIGIVVEGRLYLKADAQTEPAFAATGNGPFVYPSPKGPMPMSYWSVPEEALDSAEAMAPWARLAKEAALRKAAAKAKPRVAKGSPGQPKPRALKAAAKTTGPAAPRRKSPDPSPRGPGLAGNPVESRPKRSRS